ncbi:MAG: hypothetical protein ACKE51_01435 [Methylococcaceae bacterium]
MIELNSILVILMIEVFGCMVFFLFRSALLFKRTGSEEQLAVEELIDKLEDTGRFKTKKMAEMISSHCAIEPDELKQLLSETAEAERVLYRHIVQMFFNKDVNLLREIDQPIDGLSAPYCKIIMQASSIVLETENRNIAENKINVLLQQNESLGKQLNEAINTMEEISTEYTRVFSGTQTELVLNNSSKNMLNIFKNAEHQVKTLVKAE